MYKIILSTKFFFIFVFMIPKTKFGNCSDCGKRDTNVVKVGKLLYCISCRNAQKAEQYMKNATDRAKKNKENGEYDRQALIHDLDFVFSRYIRTREATPKGFVSCYTCGKIDLWNNMQCGHFVKRGETLLRWDTRNAKTQCPECNVSLYGNMEIYEKKLNEEFPGLPEQLREESREPYKYSREELKELLIELRSRLKMSKLKFE